MFNPDMYVSDLNQNADTGVIIKEITLCNENFSLKAILLLSTILKRTSITLEGVEHHAIEIKSSTKLFFTQIICQTLLILSIFFLDE